MKEWQRTVLLVILLLAAIGFLVWANQTADSSLQP